MSVKPVWGVVKTAAANWAGDGVPRLGAALSYYTVFALAPLLVIALFVASLWFDRAAVKVVMFDQLQGLVGARGADAIQTALKASMPQDQGIVATILAAAMLVLTASGLFVELQGALNAIWGVEKKPGHAVKGFVKARLLSFGMIVGIGFLLLVSLIVSAVIAAVSKYVAGLTPGMDVLWHVVNALVSLGIVTVLFAMIFKILPDVRIAWKDVWVGAFVTGVLFTLGKSLLGLWLGKNAAVSAYGAAGSLVLILLWVYYSSQILFFGAEITQVYANRYGTRLEPKLHARWVDPSAAPAPGRLKGKIELDPSSLTPAERQARLIEKLRQQVEAMKARRMLHRPTG